MLTLKRLCVIVLAWVSCCACINTSYSRLDEVEITDDVVHLVIGAFAHHGEAFYKNELARTGAILDSSPDDFEARNDLASAHTKLGNYKEAERLFKQNEQRFPGRYKTASNRGVLYKKMGRYDLSADYLKQSFEIKPGGHMGLADYYLKMVQWLEAVQGDPLHDKDFLGRPYATAYSVSGTSSGVETASRENLITLLKNDYLFPDVYVALGRSYELEQDYQMALRCYHRAQNLGHPHRVAGDSVQRVTDKMVELAVGGMVFDHEGLGMQLVEEEDQAEAWLEDYREIEKMRIEKALPVDFASMKVALANENVSKPKVLEAGLFRGEETEDSNSFLMPILSLIAIPFLVAGAGVVVLVVVIIKLCRQKAATANIIRPTMPG